MKKQYTIAAVIVLMAAVLTGCSWDDVKAKFVGDPHSADATSSAVSGGPVEIEDYDPLECIKLSDYKGVEVNCKVKDSEIEDQKNNYLSQYPKEKKIKKGTCSTGDTVNMDYVGKIDGKEFDNGSAEDQELTIGNSGFIEGFDEGMDGMKVGETKDLNLQFPDPYTNDPDLAGKDVVFTVTINYKIKTSPNTFDDKFVKKYTSYKTVEEFEKETRKAIQTNKEESAGYTAITTITENSELISAPATLKEAYRRQMDAMNRASIQMSYGDSVDFDTVLAQMGYTKESYEDLLDKTAESQVKYQMVVEAIIAKENIPEPTDQEMSDYVSQMATSAQMTLDNYKQYYQFSFGDAISFDDYNLTAYHYDKAAEFVKKNAKIKK